MAIACMQMLKTEASWFAEWVGMTWKKMADKNESLISRNQMVQGKSQGDCESNKGSCISKNWI